jgi:hypothetical protein
MAAHPKPVPGINMKRINVHPGGAQPDPEYLSKSNHEEAVFSTKVSKSDVEVVFDHGTPFSGTNFRVYANTEVGSGALRTDVEVGKHYHYRVDPMKGGPGTDPEIIITP